MAAAGLPCGSRPHGVDKKSAQARRFEKIRIKIGGGHSGGQAQPGSVNVVRPFLEGLHRHATRHKGAT